MTTPKSKKVIQDAQFREEDIQALGLTREAAGAADDEELAFGNGRPVTLMDGITMDETGGITRAGRNINDDYGNSYYYD